MIVKTKPIEPANPNDELCHLKLRDGSFAIIDPDLHPVLSRFSWFLKKSKSVLYVVRKEKTPWGSRYIRLHRQVTACPPDKVVHHRNHNPRDNRRCQLQICDERYHNQIAAFDVDRHGGSPRNQQPGNAGPETPSVNA